jgi:hypothetical protein
MHYCMCIDVYNSSYWGKQVQTLFLGGLQTFQNILRNNFLVKYSVMCFGRTGLPRLFRLHNMQIRSPNFLNFKEPRNRFQVTNFARPWSLADRYDNPIPSRF